jgi:hypothetical protein
MKDAKSVEVLAIGDLTIDLKSSTIVKLDKVSKENYGFENQLIGKHGSMVRIASRFFTNTLYLVESFNKKAEKKEYYVWVLETEKANQKAVGHYLKVNKATVITESNEISEGLASLLS